MNKNKKIKKATWSGRLKKRVYLFFGYIALQLLIGHYRKRKEIETKFKYFKPTIHEGFFGKSVRWKARKKPLTKEELDQF